ncbi:heavy metal translocating P-type ATPase [Alteromonadaceae bacterium BrNp21-10]|nr:heavy metal translocating P-type ATPase [Alteromonadaceae bacterium BrNp21-10]
MNRICFHCDQPVESQSTYLLDILGEPRAMCCPGCQAVASAIVDNGLEDYYRYRTHSAEPAKVDLEQLSARLKPFDQPQLQQEFVHSQNGINEVQLTLEGIHCAACGWLIERQLQKLPGVVSIAVNVTARRALLKWRSDQVELSDILANIEKIGYHPLPFQLDSHEASYQKENKSALKRLGVAGLMTMQIMMLAFGLYFGVFGHIDPHTKTYLHWLSLLLCTPVVFYSGSQFLSSAINALRHRSINMDVPVAIAIIAVFSSSAWATWSQQGEVFFESVAMFIFLLSISRYLEHRSRHRAAEISSNVLHYIPVTANKVDEQGAVSICLAKALAENDLILIKAGEQVPVDAVITGGESYIDESMLTGEFEPNRKQTGDTILGGTINQTNVIYARVTKVLDKALINQIVRMQEHALLTKPHIAVIADRFSQYFVIAVLAIAAATFAYWHMQGNTNALFISISVLVATCPCALGLATPTALSCAFANLNRHGILIKNSNVLEKLTKIDAVALDKTGTLTQGKLSLQKWHCTLAGDEARVMQIASSIEHYSEHPIASAFNTEVKLLACEKLQIFLGEGLSAEIGPHHYKIGSASFVAVDIANDLTDARVFLTEDDQLIAAFYLDDELRDDADALIQGLAKYALSLISGDNQQQVTAVAKRLGITDFYFACTPQRKLELLQQKQQTQQLLVMGDGINDGPALAAAFVAVAVGNAADLSKSSADVVLLNNKLSNILLLLDMAHRCQNKIRQNLLWALGYNVLILPLAVSGLLAPWMAVIGMSLSSIIVVVNSLRLISHQPTGNA